MPMADAVVARELRRQPVTGGVRGPEHRFVAPVLVSEGDGLCGYPDVVQPRRRRIAWEIASVPALVREVDVVFSLKRLPNKGMLPKNGVCFVDSTL